MPNVSLLQSELGIIDAQFKGLSLKKNFIEKDLKDTVGVQQFIYYTFSWIKLINKDKIVYFHRRMKSPE